MSNGPIFTGTQDDDAALELEMADMPSFEGIADAPALPSRMKVVPLNSRVKQDSTPSDATGPNHEAVEIGATTGEAGPPSEPEPLSAVVGRVRSESLGPEASYADVSPLSFVIDGVEAALARLPGADEESRRLAVDLLRQELASEIAIHPDCMGSDEQAQIARHQVLMGSIERFGKTWSTLVTETGGREQQLAADMFKLVSTALNGHAGRIQLALDTQRSRDEMLKLAQANGQAAAAPTSNIVSQAITAMWNAGAQTVKGAIDGIKNLGDQKPKKVTSATLAPELRREPAMVPKPTPSAVSESIEPQASTSDVDMAQWRAKRMEDSLREAERLSEELALNLGDADWESGRGRELTEDFMKAIETVNAMADDNAIDPAKMEAMTDRLEGIRTATEDAAGKSATDKMKEQIKVMTDSLMSLVDKVKASVQAFLGIQAQPATPAARAGASEPTALESGHTHQTPMTRRAPKLT